MSDNLYEYHTTSPYIQGDVGEVVMASELRSKCNMKVLRNLYFPLSTHFTEVDILALSNMGVFVIESKNYNGEVIGSESDKYWSVRYSISREEKLYNPIMQNIRHKEIVEGYLHKNGFDNIPIYRPVIFSNKTKLSLRDCEKSVFNLDSFIDTYNSLDLNLVDDVTINKLLDCFRPLSDQSLEMRLLHLNLLKG